MSKHMFYTNQCFIKITEMRSSAASAMQNKCVVKVTRISVSSLAILNCNVTK